MSTNMGAPANPDTKGQLKAWHALAWFLGFFGFMFAVNGVFLWTALTTFPGEDVEKSYLTGIDYNREIARRAYQADKGWGAEIGLAGQAPNLEIRVRLSELDGSVLPVAGTTLQLRHPADRALDQTLELIPTGGGEYVTSVNDLAPGTWTVQFSADVDPAAEGHEFRASRQVRVP